MMEANHARADEEAVRVGLGCLVKSKKKKNAMSFPNVLVSHVGSTLGKVPYRAGHPTHANVICGTAPDKQLSFYL